MKRCDITEADLQAFVDGQLSQAEQVRVLLHLMNDQEAARRVLADLGANASLRVLEDCDSHSSPSQAGDMARRLDRRLDARFSRARMSQFFAMALIAVAVPMLLVLGGPHLRFGTPANASPKPYIAEALMSHRVALVRERMQSQIETPAFDPRDVRAATRIAIPQLPAGSRIIDAQIFPSDYGPSLQVMIASRDGTRLSLFAVRMPADSTVSKAVRPEPALDRVGDADVAYWAQRGNIYVLTAAMPASQIVAIARDLSNNPDA
ncbi:anti-sigma factor family protein [Rhizorhapis sp. SPR117]|uniref:anti-sigma factor family protein n=1 Tax=Rhizorhapis sp. SPR117 TaxID=2912611 RepID=UPI001F23229A|nr:anti-sigma factor [Rhizorhapis sp. SPR117]